MSTQQPSKIRKALLSTIALLCMGLPLSSVLLSNPAMAHQKPKHPHTTMPTPTPAPTPAPMPSPAPTSMPTQPTYMEGYAFNYKYVTQPVINGVAVTEGYAGVGYAPVGTYHTGQTINITDNFGRTIGTYTIAGVNDKTPFAANQLNKVIVGEYDYGTTRITSSLTSTGGDKGLGSESGQLIGYGLEGTNVNFNNQRLGIVAHHF